MENGITLLGTLTCSKSSTDGVKYQQSKVESSKNVKTGKFMYERAFKQFLCCKKHHEHLIN